MWWRAGGRGARKARSSPPASTTPSRAGCSGCNVHDMNWIKGFRREVIETLPPLRSDWHRFLLHIAAHQGYRIGEVPTPWQKRRAGPLQVRPGRASPSRCSTCWSSGSCSPSAARPMRFFGGLGLTALVVQRAHLPLPALALARRARRQMRPLFWVAGGLAIAGLLLFLIGFLAELIVSQGERLADVERRLR